MNRNLRTTLDAWYPTFERYWRLLRPKTYASMAWFCVAAGVAAAGAQIWAPVLEALAHEYLNLQIKLLQPSWIGPTLIALGLPFAFLSHWAAGVDYRRARELQAKTSEHDEFIIKSVFNQIDEQFVAALGDDLCTDHTCDTAQAERLRTLVWFLDKESSRAIDTALQAALSDLKSKTESLALFLAVNFFVFPKGQTARPLRLAMHPGLNVDREGRGHPDDSIKYGKYEDQLETLEKAFALSFQELIRTTRLKHPARLHH